MESFLILECSVLLSEEFTIYFMKKILITGFEPFGTDSRNPSGEAVSLLSDTADHKLYKLTLPVTWQGAFVALSAAWDEIDPDGILMVGLAGGADRIRIERVGINLCGAIKDNDGLYPDGSSDIPTEAPVSEDGANAYFATYNEKEILSALKANGIPAAYSYSAGTYICNYILYSSLEKMIKEDRYKKIGFIHIPYVDGQRENAPSLPMNTITAALELTLSHMF